MRLSWKTKYFVFAPSPEGVSGRAVAWTRLQGGVIWKPRKDSLYHSPFSTKDISDISWPLEVFRFGKDHIKLFLFHFSSADMCVWPGAVGASECVWPCVGPGSFPKWGHLREWANRQIPYGFGVISWGKGTERCSFKGCGLDGGFSCSLRSGNQTRGGPEEVGCQLLSPEHPSLPAASGEVRVSAVCMASKCSNKYGARKSPWVNLSPLS